MSAHLVSLRIKNLALVEELSWSPGPGFNAISGETGAGKSVLLGALNLLLGERADKSLIRTGADSCVIEAVFETQDPSPYDRLLEAAGAERCQDGQLLLKRSLSPNGSRQFANGSPCTLQLLKSLGDLLVDLHGPHDHQSLFSRDHQTRLLDQFSGLTLLHHDYTLARRRWLDAVAEEDKLSREALEAARELDLVRHQLSEIDAAELTDENEEEELTRRQKTAEHARRLLELGSQGLALLDEGEIALAGLSGDLGRLLREMTRLDESIAPLETEQTALHDAIAGLTRTLRDYLERIDEDPETLETLRQRLDLLQSLKRKYGHTVAEILTFAEERRRRLDELLRREEREKNLAGEIAAAHAATLSLGKKLSEARQKGATKLARAVAEQLTELGFQQAGFSIGLEEQTTPSASGLELAEFVFAPNPGEAPRPLRQIASSGEISRVMLALKCTLADQDEVGVLVFDEIDANVGGETATCVGQKMSELGRSRQVLCISHLPQVAAAASTHFCVEKEIRDGRTVSLLRELSGLEREEEIARMLGGRQSSAMEHARHLLRSAPEGAPKPSRPARSSA